TGSTRQGGRNAACGNGPGTAPAAEAYVCRQRPRFRWTEQTQGHGDDYLLYCELPGYLHDVAGPPHVHGGTAEGSVAHHADCAPTSSTPTSAGGRGSSEDCQRDPD